MIIRGDASAAGIVCWVLSVGIVVSFATGAVTPPTWVWAIAALGVPLGAWLMCWNRSRYRQLLGEVADAHRDADPGQSPVPWIDDDLWRKRNRFDIELDAPVQLMAEVDPLVHTYEQDSTGAFIAPLLRAVGDDERHLVTPADVPSGVPVPEPAEWNQLLEQLQTSPGRFIAAEPRWPVCCQRLATMTADAPEGIQDQVLYLYAAHAEIGIEEEARPGTHRFQCRACGRRYATDPVW